MGYERPLSKGAAGQRGHRTGGRFPNPGGQSISHDLDAGRAFLLAALLASALYQAANHDTGSRHLSSAAGTFFNHGCHQPALPQPRYPKTLNYSVYTLLPRYSKGFPGNGVYFQTQLRILNYNGSSTSSLLVQFNPAISGCLWVLKPTDVDNPDLPPLTVSALKAAHLSRIVEQPPVKGYPPADLFGKEPSTAGAISMKSRPGRPDGRMAAGGGIGRSGQAAGLAAGGFACQ